MKENLTEVVFILDRSGSVSYTHLLWVKPDEKVLIVEIH